MRRLTLIVALWTASCAHGAAQTTTDNSVLALPPADMEEIVRLVTDAYADQGAVEVRRMSQVAGRRCYGGEVNARNLFGAYTGYRRFMVDLDAETLGAVREGRAHGQVVDLTTRRAAARARLFGSRQSCGQ